MAAPALFELVSDQAGRSEAGVQNPGPRGPRSRVQVFVVRRLLSKATKESAATARGKRHLGQVEGLQPTVHRAIRAKPVEHMDDVRGFFAQAMGYCTGPR